MSHRLAAFVALLLTASSSFAQAPANPQAEPPLRRWFEIQNLTVYTRYRFIESNRDVVSANDQQYKYSFRARLNADKRKRYTLNIGAFTGTNFIGSWDNTGLGINDGDYHSHYVKQLYGAAIPVPGLELQGGGLYVVRGENTEYTSYDDDGYLVGERVSIRRPQQLYLDELSLTHGAIGGPDAQGVFGTSSTPNLFDRGDGFAHQQYTQLLATKRFSSMVSGSLDYSSASGADTIRAAVALRFKATAPLSALRYEQYRRVNAHPAAGFAITAERPITKWVRLQGGYATIDERYGNLNADRIQRGRRFFTIANIAIHGPLTAVLFVTRALDSPYTVSNRTRVDAVLQYDVLSTLRKTGKF